MKKLSITGTIIWTILFLACQKEKMISVSGVILNTTTLTLTVGESETLIATVQPADAANQTVLWSSSAPGIASVDALGKVTAVSQGTATIIVTTVDGNKMATCTVTTKSVSQLRDGDWYAYQSHTVGLGVDLVCIGDGYTAMEIADDKYETDIRTAIEGFFDIQPYKAYRDYFNVYIVGAESTESGIGTDGKPKNSKFSSYHGEGTWMTTDYNLCFTYAQKAPVRDMDQTVILLIANSSKYAGTCWWWGSGRTIAICAVPTSNYPRDFISVVHHEAGGHGFGKLADEYVSEATAADRDRNDIPVYQAMGWFANVDITNDVTKIIWKDFIGRPKYGMVGAFEGAYYFATGVWRPEQESCMINNIAYYNAPSRAAIVKRIKILAGESFDVEWFMSNDVMDSYTTVKSSTGWNSLPILAPPVWVRD